MGICTLDCGHSLSVESATGTTTAGFADLQVFVDCNFLSWCFNMSNGFHQIVNEKLERNNYPAWKFRMTNFLKGKGYLDYVDGDNEVAPETPERNATTE